MWTLTHLSLWRPGPLWPECDWTAPLPPYWDKINKEIRTGAARGLLADLHCDRDLTTKRVIVSHNLLFMMSLLSLGRPRWLKQKGRIKGKITIVAISHDEVYINVNYMTCFCSGYYIPKLALFENAAHDVALHQKMLPYSNKNCLLSTMLTLSIKIFCSKQIAQQHSQTVRIGL